MKDEDEDLSKSSIQVWQPSRLSGLELARGTNCIIRVPRHSHEEFELHVVQGGAGKCLCRGTSHIATAGQITLIQSGQPHTALSVDDAGCSFRGMYVSRQLFADAASQLADRRQDTPYFPESHLTDTYLGIKFLELHAAIEGMATRLEQEGRLLALLVQFVTRFAAEHPSARRPGQEHQAVKKAREYIEDNFCEDISLEDLVRIAHLSPFHLSRVFSREVGVPPHVFQTQVRLTRAKSLLLQGLPISHVAIEVGFYDHAHFTHYFRQYVQVTPSEYVRSSNAKRARFS